MGTEKYLDNARKMGQAAASSALSTLLHTMSKAGLICDSTVEAPVIPTQGQRWRVQSTKDNHFVDYVGTLYWHVSHDQNHPLNHWTLDSVRRDDGNGGGDLSRIYDDFWNNPDYTMTLLPAYRKGMLLKHLQTGVLYHLLSVDVERGMLHVRNLWKGGEARVSDSFLESTTRVVGWRSENEELEPLPCEIAAGQVWQDEQGDWKILSYQKDAPGYMPLIELQGVGNTNQRRLGEMELRWGFIPKDREIEFGKDAKPLRWKMNVVQKAEAYEVPKVTPVANLKDKLSEVAAPVEKKPACPRCGQDYVEGFRYADGQCSHFCIYDTARQHAKDLLVRKGNGEYEGDWELVAWWVRGRRAEMLASGVPLWRLDEMGFCCTIGGVYHLREERCPIHHPPEPYGNGDFDTFGFLRP